MDSSGAGVLRVARVTGAVMATVAMAILTAATSAVVAGSVSPTIVLASASGNRTVELGDIDALDRHRLAVTWEEQERSYLRFSEDGGASFGPTEALRDGRRAIRPRVAICGSFLFAASTWLLPD